MLASVGIMRESLRAPPGHFGYSCRPQTLTTPAAGIVQPLLCPGEVAVAPLAGFSLRRVRATEPQRGGGQRASQPASPGEPYTPCLSQGLERVVQPSAFTTQYGVAFTTALTKLTGTLPGQPRQLGSFLGLVRRGCTAGSRREERRRSRVQTQRACSCRTAYGLYRPQTRGWTPEGYASGPPRHLEGAGWLLSHGACCRGCARSCRMGPHLQPREPRPHRRPVPIPRPRLWPPVHWK